MPYDHENNPSIDGLPGSACMHHTYSIYANLLGSMSIDGDPEVALSLSQPLRDALQDSSDAQESTNLGKWPGRGRSFQSFLDDSGHASIYTRIIQMAAD